jgi:ferric-dicitrate binding protein FerR (iron transport regulator)
MSEFGMSPRHEEAARWFAALRRGVMSVEECEAYEDWRRDRANRSVFAELEHTWNALEGVKEHLAGAGARSSRPSASRTFGRPALVAAMCAVSLVIGVLSYSGHSSFWTTLDWTDR